MEADWEVDLGPGSPVIDVAWSGFVDLQRYPDQIKQISESTSFPRLAAALLRINAQSAFPPDQQTVGLQTVKCDLWSTGPCDPYEMDATPSTSLCGIACYIDLVPRLGGFFFSLKEAELRARHLTETLRSQSSPTSRVDLIVRQAVTTTTSGFGITAYISACGASSETSEEALGRALDVFSDVVQAAKNPPSPKPTPQP